MLRFWFPGKAKPDLLGGLVQYGYNKCCTVMKVWTQPHANTEENVKQTTWLEVWGLMAPRREIWGSAWALTGEQELSRENEGKAVKAEARKSPSLET